ncbi:MAG: ABC transporter substrate-binding protein [Acidobacteriota bacterium]
MRIHERTWVSLLSWVALLVLFNACGDTGRPLKVGLVTWVGSGPFYLAEERDFFDGLEVELEVLDDAAGRRSALASGALDAMLATVDDFANAAAAGVPAVAVLKTDDSLGADGIVAGSEIRSVAELAGKTIAFPQGMPSHFFLLNVAERNGLAISEVKPRFMEAGEAGGAFVAGKVDAAVTWEPWLSQASDREGGHVLATTREYPGLISDILVVRRDVLFERPADLVKLLSGWFRAVELWQQEESASNRSMAAALGLAEDDFAAMVAGIKYADLEENLAYFGVGEGGGSAFDLTFEAAGRAWEVAGLVRDARPSAGFAEVSPLVQLASEEKQ